MGYSVLIVDDSPAMRGFIRRVMNLSGFELSECLEASHGEDALAQLHKHAVDVVLTDINMPRMDGEEMLRRLDSEGLLQGLPVVVISTDATRDRIRRMLELGASGYISKPFTPEALREELERVLGEHDASRA